VLKLKKKNPAPKGQGRPQTECLGYFC